MQEIINAKKVGSLLSYIVASAKDVNLRKLIKLVYLIDEASITKRGFSLTWLDYYAWKKGPVSPYIYNVKYKDNPFNHFVEAEAGRDGKLWISSNVRKDVAMLQFSQREIKIIDEVLALYGNKKADELTDITHEVNTPWSLAVEAMKPNFEKDGGKTDILLDMRLLLDGDEEKINTFEDAKDIAFF